MDRLTVYGLFGIALIAGLFYFYQPHSTFEFVIREGSIRKLAVINNDLGSAPKHLRVNQDDLVTIKITVDEDDELHIYGYEKRIELKKDNQAEISFTAGLAGKFQIELERTKTDLGIIEVLPR